MITNLTAMGIYLIFQLNAPMNEKHLNLEEAIRSCVFTNDLVSWCRL